MDVPTGALTPRRYSGVAIALHWIVAVLVVCGFSLGLYMVDMGFSPQKLKYYSWHKWIGVTVFTLVVVRLAWRLTHVPPPLPASTPRWQVAAAGASHMLLYVCLIAGPLTGWLYSSSAGVPTVPFGISALQLPDLVGKDEALATTLKFVHRSIVYSFGLLVCIHVAAAVKHALGRDGIMSRMLP